MTVPASEPAFGPAPERPSAPARRGRPKGAGSRYVPIGLRLEPETVAALDALARERLPVHAQHSRSAIARMLLEQAIAAARR